MLRDQHSELSKTLNDIREAFRVQKTYCRDCLEQLYSTLLRPDSRFDEVKLRQCARLVPCGNMYSTH